MFFRGLFLAGLLSGVTLQAELLTNPFLAEFLPAVTLEQAKAAFDGDRAVFVDGRASFYYNIKHIRGAWNCSLGGYAKQIGRLKKEIPLERPLIVYCSNETCGQAEKVAKKLVQDGFQNVSVLTNGIQAWIEAGYPVEP